MIGMHGNFFFLSDSISLYDIVFPDPSPGDPKNEAGREKGVRSKKFILMTIFYNGIMGCKCVRIRPLAVKTGLT
jgi:hypothetical protein